MPLTRRLPKRGFNNARFKIVYHPINLAALNAFEDGSVVDRAALIVAGLINSRSGRIKILGTGELKKKLTVKAESFSTAARLAIEKLGGQVEIAK